MAATTMATGTSAAPPAAMAPGNIEDLKVLDRNGNGFITAGELRHVRTDRGGELTYEEAEEAIPEADVDGDDQINCEEYVERVKAAHVGDEESFSEDGAATANDESECHVAEGEHGA